MRCKKTIFPSGNLMHNKIVYFGLLTLCRWMLCSKKCFSYSCSVPVNAFRLIYVCFLLI